MGEYGESISLFVFVENIDETVQLYYVLPLVCKKTTPNIDINMVTLSLNDYMHFSYIISIHLEARRL